VNEGNEEEGGEEEEAPTNTQGDRGNIRGGLIVELELGRALIDDR
jgi:hypothetical protein